MIFFKKKTTIPLLNGWIAELPNGEFITSLSKPKNSEHKFKRIKLQRIKWNNA